MIKKTALWALLAGLLLPATVMAAISIQHWETSRGSRVYFLENHALPMLDLAVDVPAGSRYDPVGKLGLANLVGHLLSGGAGRRSEEQISEDLAGLGIVMDTDVDDDRAGIHMRSLATTEATEKAIGLMGNMLGAPQFPAPVLAREKGRVIAAIREARLKPEVEVSRTLMAKIYGKHPYGRPTEGEIADLQRIAVTDLKRFHADRYRAGSAVISIVGAVSRERAEAIAEQLSGAMLPGQAPSAQAIVAESAPGVYTVAHPATQAHIMLGQLGIPRGHPDYYALYLGNYVLGGGGFSSRLMETVREKSGLVYSVYSYFSPLAETGAFVIGLQTKQDQAAKATQMVREVLRDYVAKGPTEAELAAAKSNLIGGFALRTDSNAKQHDYLRVIGFYRLPLNYLEIFPQRVGQLTREEVTTALQRHLKPDALVEVTTGTPHAK